MWVITNEEQTLFLAYDLGKNSFYWANNSEFALKFGSEFLANNATDNDPAINDYLNFCQPHLWYVNKI